METWTLISIIKDFLFGEEERKIKEKMTDQEYVTYSNMKREMIRKRIMDKRKHPEPGMCYSRYNYKSKKMR